VNGGTYTSGTAFLVRETFGILSVPGDPTSFVPTDPTAVTFTVRDPAGTIFTYINGIDAEVTNPSVGVYELRQGPLSLAGFWTYRAQGTGAVEAVSEGDWTILSSSVISPPITEFLPSPCTPWCDAQDAWIACGSPTTTIGSGSSTTQCPVDMKPYAMMASWLLFELSGRLYSGRCERTVRPCSNTPCGFQVLSRGHIVWPDGIWGWGDWNGGWGWNYPNYGDCGCMPLDRINLAGYPVREILEVKIDGIVIPEAFNWRLDKRRFLTRMADANGNAQRWPACQHMNEDDTEVGTFSVSYAYGDDPPLLGSLAAAQIACEIYSGSTGGECALPAGTIRVTRQGVTVDKMAALGWFRSSTRGWQTGIGIVDAFLNGANPNGLTRRPMMMAPGNRRGRFAQSVGS
jgi:hypothetical protein